MSKREHLPREQAEIPGAQIRTIIRSIIPNVRLDPVETVHVSTDRVIQDSRVGAIGMDSRLSQGKLPR